MSCDFTSLSQYFSYTRTKNDCKGLSRLCALMGVWFTLTHRLLSYLSFRTDRSGQTVQTQIRLLLERSSLIRVYTVCNSLCIVWMHYSKEKPSCSTFRMITANFQVSEILGCLQYSCFMANRGLPVLEAQLASLWRRWANKWALSSENVSSEVCDRVTFKPACSATETS